MKIACPDCGREVAMHEMDTQTVAQSDGFKTRYRCPYCRVPIDDVFDLV